MGRVNAVRAGKHERSDCRFGGGGAHRKHLGGFPVSLRRPGRASAAARTCAGRPGCG